MFRLSRWLPLMLALSMLISPVSARSQNHSQPVYLPLVSRPAPTPDRTFDYAAPPVPGVLDVANFRIWIPGDVPILRGAVVYTPGINSDGRDFVTDPAWQAIARQWQFALIGDQFVGPDWGYF